MNRRPATREDLKVGATVYKGNGKAAWKVTEVGHDDSGAAFVAVCKPSTFHQRKPGAGSMQSPAAFTVEA